MTLVWCFLSPFGRLTRQEFILATLGILATGFALRHMFETVALAGLGDKMVAYSQITSALAKAKIATMLLQAWPIYVVNRKRLQDLDLSGMWLLPAYVIILGGVAVSPPVAEAAFFSGLLFLALKKGTADQNRYGPAPLGK